MEMRLHLLGRIGYDEAHALQRRLVEERAIGAGIDTLLALEHDPILTLGRNASAQHLHLSEAEYAARGIAVRRVERGGEVTYHGPGHLVVYPIVALHRANISLRAHIRALEGALVDGCAAYGVTAERRDSAPGCWVGDRKIGELAEEPLLKQFAYNPSALYKGLVSCVGSDYCNLAVIETKRKAVEVAKALPGDIVDRNADGYLDVEEFAKSPFDYKTFNEFFYRALRPEARPITPGDEIGVFPADGRHLGFANVDTAEGFYVKGAKFTFAELFGSAEAARPFAGGSMLISRLCPVDYHRFHFPVGGLATSKPSLRSMYEVEAR